MLPVLLRSVNVANAAASGSEMRLSVVFASRCLELAGVGLESRMPAFSIATLILDLAYPFHIAGTVTTTEKGVLATALAPC